jgi:hypothetical protein
MDEPTRVFWSVEECRWVPCPPVEISVPDQRADEPEQVVRAES